MDAIIGNVWENPELLQQSVKRPRSNPVTRARSKRKRDYTIHHTKSCRSSYTSAAHAEPTSIRCAEAYGKEPYLGQGKQFVCEMAEIVLRCTPSI